MALSVVCSVVAGAVGAVGAAAGSLLLSEAPQLQQHALHCYKRRLAGAEEWAAVAGNVLLCSNPQQPHGFSAKISDFGLSRNLSIQSKIETRTYGTITHMPLELLCDGIMSKVRGCQK